MVPVSMLVNDEGKVIDIFYGAEDWSSKDILNRLEDALKE